MVSKDKNYKAILSVEEIKLILERDVGSKNFELVEFHVGAFSDNPTGFLGIHIKIRAVIKLGEEMAEKNYFAKKIPEDIPSHNRYANETRAFYKEIEFYEAVVKDVEMNMTPGRKLTKWCPRFLYARGTEILVIEDLCCQGYYMYPERTVMDLDSIKASVVAMAAMHSGPMILEQKLRDGKVTHFPKGWTPDQSPDLTHVYKRISFETEVNPAPGSAGNTFYEAGFKSQVAIVDLLPNYTQEQKIKIKGKLIETLRRLFKYVEPSKKFRNTWLHGDLWANNVMFKNRGDGKVNDALIVDFQLARLCPPAQDVLFLIHQVQSRQFRKDYLPQILNWYYEAFTKEVNAEGYDVETILPKEDFDESCKYYYDFCLLSQVMFYQMTLSPARITSKFLASPELFDLNMLTDRTAMVVETYQTDELCRNRITEAMDELIEYFQLA